MLVSTDICRNQKSEVETEKDFSVLFILLTASGSASISGLARTFKFLEKKRKIQYIQYGKLQFASKTFSKKK